MTETKLQHYFFTAFAAATNTQLAMTLCCPGCMRRFGTADRDDHISCSKPPTRAAIRDNIATIITTVDRYAVLQGYYEEVKTGDSGSTMFGYELFADHCPFMKMSHDSQWTDLLIEYLVDFLGLSNKLRKEDNFGGYEIEVLSKRKRPLT